MPVRVRVALFRRSACVSRGDDRMALLGLEMGYPGPELDGLPTAL
jgi:hypothetical protein